MERHDEWLSVYGFVRPSTGRSWWCLLPTVNTAAMALALATFARDEGIDADHRAVLVVDQAGWHIAHDLVLPEGIDLVLPARRLAGAATGRTALDAGRRADRQPRFRQPRRAGDGAGRAAAAPSRPILSASKPTPISTGGPPTHRQDAQ